MDLIVVVAFVVGRRRWLKRQPGEFSSAIRVSDGELPRLQAKWKRGPGRWLNNVLLWSKAAFMFRDQLVVADVPPTEVGSPAEAVKRLGEHPVVFSVQNGKASIEMAVKAEDRSRVAVESFHNDLLVTEPDPHS
ncbi:MAG: hypothetical protein ACLQPH_11325 [Acidimicrobiales bacterium]